MVSRRGSGQWAYFKRVTLDFSRLAKPTDNTYIESFNARLRQELLNASWFLSLADARQRTKCWRKDSYAQSRDSVSRSDSNK